MSLSLATMRKTCFSGYTVSTPLVRWQLSKRSPMNAPDSLCNVQLISGVPSTRLASVGDYFIEPYVIVSFERPHLPSYGFSYPQDTFPAIQEKRQCSCEVKSMIGKPWLHNDIEPYAIVTFPSMPSCASYGFSYPRDSFPAIQEKPYEL